MNLAEEIYLQQLELCHRQSESTKEYITYMNARKEFCSKLSDELFAEFEKLMDLKLDVEDVEGLYLFKSGIAMQINK